MNLEHLINKTVLLTLKNGWELNGKLEKEIFGYSIHKDGYYICFFEKDVTTITERSWETTDNVYKELLAKSYLGKKVRITTCIGDVFEGVFEKYNIPRYYRCSRKNGYIYFPLSVIEKIEEL